MPVKVISCQHIMSFNSVTYSSTLCWLYVCSSIDGQGHDSSRVLVALAKADGTRQQAAVPMQSLGLASPANNPSLLFGCHWWAKWNSYIWLESGPAGIWLELMVSSWFTKTAVYCISLFCLNWSPGECSCLCSSRTQNARHWEERITKNGQTWSLEVGHICKPFRIPHQVSNIENKN